MRGFQENRERFLRIKWGGGGIEKLFRCIGGGGIFGGIGYPCWFGGGPIPGGINIGGGRFGGRWGGI